jgi:hypothetical protein
VSTYREIVGKKIKKVSSDPSSGLDGEMWYNSTTGTLRGLALSEAWISATAMPIQNYGAGAAGTQTALVYFGGSTYDGSAPFPRVSTTLEYNGSGWASSGAYTGSLNYLGGCGTQTAAMGAGGFSGTANTTASAEYNGSTWTAGNSMSQQRMNMGANFIGIQTAAAVVGGDQYPSTPRSVSTVEEYDGTNFSSATAYPMVIQNIVCAGPQTAGWVAGGQSDITPPSPNTIRNNVNFYDGTNWTASTALPVATHRAGGCGTQTAALFFGGQLASPTTPLTTAYGFDGTSWTAKPSLSLGRVYIASGGVSTTSTAAIGAGGYDPGPGSTSATEEFTVSTNVITAAAWASGDTLNTGRLNVSMGGIQTAGIVLGGHTSPGAEPKGVETYDGSSFTAGTAIGPYPGDYAAYAGPSTTGIIFGGAPYSTNTAVFDGEWAAGPALNTGRSQLMGAGVGQPSAVAIGGFSSAPTAAALTEKYDGSSWSESGDLSTARGQGAGFGIETAAVCAGGNTPAAVTDATEEYGGTSWTTGGDLITATGVFIGGWGTQTDGIVVGGGTPPYVTTTLGYDGTSWSTRPNAANAAGRTQTAGADGSAGLRAGGGPNTTQRDGSEEYTGETTAANIEDFTTS